MFHVRLLFQKLHQKWLALAIFHQQPYEQINAMIKIKIKEKAWFECLTICLNQMNELQQIINHQNKKPGFFQGLISG